jgi:hypothetical protein
MRTVGLLLAALLALLVAAPPAVTAQAARSQAAPPPPVKITPDVDSLPQGAAPKLPYVDVRAKRIVDGSRRVSISGLVGTVRQLFKVSGGYVLARKSGSYDDLVMVRSDGHRSVLVSQWIEPGWASLEQAVAVAGSGTQLVANTYTLNPRQYAGTVVVSLPDGTVTHRRKFSWSPTLGGYRDGRVLAGLGNVEIIWWRPSTDATSTIVSDVSLEQADLTAGEFAYRPGGDYYFRGIPPRTTPDWLVTQEDSRVGSWSPDDTKVITTAEIEDGTKTASHAVHRTVDGSVVTGFSLDSTPQATWESDATILLTAYAWPESRYQVIRCKLTGPCSRVGPESTTPLGTYVLASRRTS